MERVAARRALLWALGFIVLILAAFDLTRKHSLLRQLVGIDPPSRQERVLDELKRRGLPVPDRGGSASVVGTTERAV